jgi:hypothetical protein
MTPRNPSGMMKVMRYCFPFLVYSVLGLALLQALFGSFLLCGTASAVGAPLPASVFPASALPSSVAQTLNKANQLANQGRYNEAFAL